MILPLYDCLDFVVRMVGKGIPKIYMVVAMGDEAREVITPALVGLEQVVGGDLEMGTGGIDAAYHHLIIQHELPNEIGARDL